MTTAKKYYNPKNPTDTFPGFYGSFIPNVVQRNPKLSSSAKCVYGRLSEYCHGKSDSCYPSLSQLVAQTGLCKSTVIKAIKELETKGFIEVTRPQKEEHLMHYHNSYRFLWHPSFYEADADKDIRNNILQPTDIPTLQPTDLPVLSPLDSKAGIDHTPQAGIDPIPLYKDKKSLKKKHGLAKGSSPSTPSSFSNPKTGEEYGEDPMKEQHFDYHHSDHPTSCQRCDGKMIWKNGERGGFWGCSNFKKKGCTYTFGGGGSNG